MSPLTKVFVVLLVVLSLLLAAASVTFLNTLPDYQRDISTLRAAQEASLAERTRAVSVADSQRAAAEQRAGELNNLLSDANAAVAELRTQLARAQAENADLQGQIAQANTTQAALSQAVNANTSLVSSLRDQLGTLRENFDRTLDQNIELAKTNAQLGNDLEYTRRALRAAEENNKANQDRVAQLSGRLRELGDDPDRDFSAGEVTAPPIAGVIRQRQQIGGRPHAEISVGSEDDVKVGMRFNVIDAETGELVGFVTILEVDDQVSVGLLSGPRVDRIGPNDEVRTRV